MSYILKKALTEMVSGAKFFGDTMRPNWAQSDYKFALFCIQEGIVTQAELEDMVRKRLLAWGRENYDWLRKKGVHKKWPDHSPCPSALAFAIHEGELAPREIAKIEFDHGDTAETFGLSLINDLVSVTSAQLLQPE